jgi:ATP-dependent Clp protease ATP-binding subunit ClpX
MVLARAAADRHRIVARRAVYNACMALPPPAQIAQALSQRVIGQTEAVREMSVALAKKLAGLRTGNILLIGSSGSGKTTLMQAVEALLASNPALSNRSCVVRVHANVLGEDAQQGTPGEKLLLRLLNHARQQLGPEASIGRLLDQASHGLVFVDEVDKIRARVGGSPNVSGIRAQEALLTLIENEAVPLRLPDWAGSETVAVDSSSLLFVCAGAFEGLYDSVYTRVTSGQDKGALKPVTVVEGGRVREEYQFSLRDWLKNEDLFEYGVTPQFLSRFDAVVLLDNLKEDDLLRVFLNSPESGLRQSIGYFNSQGIKLELTEPAARRIAREAVRHPRLGARALKEIFRRVIRPYEFDPQSQAKNGALRIDVAEVERALAPFRTDGGRASGTAGWDSSAPIPWDDIQGSQS